MQHALEKGKQQKQIRLARTSMIVQYIVQLVEFIRSFAANCHDSAAFNNKNTGILTSLGIPSEACLPASGVQLEGSTEAWCFKLVSYLNAVQLGNLAEPVGRSRFSGLRCLQLSWICSKEWGGLFRPGGIGGPACSEQNCFFGCAGRRYW